MSFKFTCFIRLNLQFWKTSNTTEKEEGGKDKMFQVMEKNVQLHLSDLGR